MDYEQRPKVHMKSGDPIKGYLPFEKNTHPTLKPFRLMLYLIMLATKPGYLVLDPFAGTGTTGMAAKALGRDFICIEKEQKWCDVARARIEATASLEPALPLSKARR